MQLLLGPFPFSISTTAYDQLSRNSGWTWQGVNRVGQAPALQYTGPTNETISMDGRLVPPFTGGVEQLARMRLLANFAKPLPLVDGRGRFYGMWVIEAIDDTGSKHFKNGYPKLTTFNISLKKYSDGMGLIKGLTKISKVVSLFG
jgi:phage protein U